MNKKALGIVALLWLGTGIFVIFPPAILLGFLVFLSVVVYKVAKDIFENGF